MSLFDDLLKDPRALSGMGGSLNFASHVVGGLSHIDFGRMASKAAGFQTDQLRANAGTAQAAAQREAISVDQRAQMVMSRALAVAAASGGGASDPSVVNTIARIASEGAYRKQLALYEGNAAAETMRLRANVAEMEGEQRQYAEGVAGVSQFLGAGTSLLRSAAKSMSLYEKYGAGGPNKAPGADW